MTDKAELRRSLIRQRMEISTIEKAERSARIAQRVLALSAYKNAENILMYAAVRNEVETHGLIRQAISDGKRIYLPVTRGRRKMDAVRIQDRAELVAGRLDIPEPKDGAIISPAEIDLVLVPGVAFDRTGARIGYGAGYFDAYLKNVRCAKLALAFDAQILERIDAEPHDVRMDGIITESEYIVCTGEEI